MSRKPSSKPGKCRFLRAGLIASLLAQRVEMGLAHRQYMDDEAVAMLRDQLLLAWRAQQGSLVRVLARRDHDLDVTGELLAALIRGACGNGGLA